VHDGIAEFTAKLKAMGKNKVSKEAADKAISKSLS